ncbi:MAG: hypothetical protein RL653_3247 [Pseudomonadota bacterium]|jgi:hypothetical protein
MRFRLLTTALLSAALLAACGKEPLPPLGLAEGCQPLLGGADCFGPFPSDYFRAPDASLPSGHRLQLTQAARVRTTVGPVDPLAWKPVDGASLVPTLVTPYPGGLSEDGLPKLLDDAAASVSADAKTLWVAADTGQRVRHYVDLDVRAKTDERRAVVFHTREGLRETTRYVVALRGLKAPGGSLAAAPEGFRRIRDREAKGDAQLEPLAARFETDVFPVLEAAGWDRKDVQLAWDFTTGTRENSARDMLRVRELTRTWLETNSPTVTLTDVKENRKPSLWRTVKGTVEGPLFLEQDVPEAALYRGDDGQVAQNGTVKFEFIAEVPVSVRDLGAEAQPLLYGHGFFGNPDEISYSTIVDLAAKMKVVTFATRWAGMSDQDAASVGAAMLSHPGEALRFTDRVHQGMANWLVFSAAVEGPLRTQAVFTRPTTGPGSTPAGAPVYAPRVRSFLGISMGHVLGGTLAALHPTLDRVMLHVGGAGFCTMMMRARPFAAFLLLLDNSVRDALEQQKLVALLQAPFDRVDPATYAPWVLAEKLPGTVDDRRVLLQFGLGDAVVPNLGSLLHAQLLGLPMLTPSAATAGYHGLAEQPGPITGSAASTADMGVDLASVYAEPNPDRPDTGVHEGFRELPHVVSQMDRFLRNGVIENFCSGPCDPD